MRRRRHGGAGSIVAAVLWLGAPALADARIGAGDPAPELAGAKDAGGKPFRLAALRGGWVVMTFGASWCKPCKKELVAWDQLASKWTGKVTFVAVNLDNDPAAGQKFMARLKLKRLRPAFAPEASTGAADAYEPPTQPTTYVIDPKGVVRALHQGYVSGDEAVLDRMLASLIK